MNNSTLTPFSTDVLILGAGGAGLFAALHAFDARPDLHITIAVKGLLGKEHGGRTITSSAELAEFILDEAEVAVVPGEAFGSPGYLRLSYALGDEDLVEGVSRIQKLLAEATD